MLRLAARWGGRARSAVLVVVALATVAAGLVGIVVTATPALATAFSNTATITIPDPNCTDPDAATPYPSNIAVSGLTGTVSDVDVTFTGITHPFQGDLEMLVVSPAGGTHNLVVLSDAGTGSLSNATVTFDDSAAGQAAQNSAWPPGTYKPTNYTELAPHDIDVFPAPAPAPSSNTTLATAFNGINPNGTWSLYVTDDACPDAGSISGGWSLNITTTQGAATSTSVGSSLNPSRTGQNVTFTATVTSGGSPVTTGTVTFTDGAATLASNVAVNGSGQAVFSTAALVEGDHLVTATYNASASFNTSSGTVNQRVDNDTTVNATTYCNTGAVTMPAVIGTAAPYPSNIFVTGFSGTVGKVTVALKNVTHNFDGDIDALLAGPTAANLVVVSDAGTAAVTNITVNLDDAAASSLPAAGAWGAANSTITVKPTDYTDSPADNFPAPAPAPSAATTLATFNGINPNGTWSLYAVGDGAPDTGSIAGGWCLTLTAAKASPAISTQASAGGPVGTSVNDVATVTGGASPTGDVTFRLFSDAACSSQVFTSTNNLSGGSATSGNFTPSAPGTYFWTAVYNGDPNNNTATSACGAANESVVIGKASPAISTQASAGGAVGTSVNDVATVTGGASPTGDVTFRLFSDAACSSQVFTSTNNLSGGSATSGSFAPAAQGAYYWTAVYNGDANNDTATSACGAANESVLVGKASPTISTQASAGGAVGSTTVSDTASLAGSFSPTGDVTFRLFSDAACTSQVFTSTNNIAGTSTTSGGYVPGGVGTYYWTAVYNGDANNNTATSACGAANESVTIAKASPTLTTQASPGNLLGAPVRDVGTLAGGFSPTGNVTFRLFSDAACATQVFTSTNDLSALSATSEWFTPVAAGTYFWTAIYNGDASNNTATSACGAPNESVVIAPFQSPPPTRTITGDLVGPVVVNSGESVLITGARVARGVTVKPGGALTVVNSKITDGITADAPIFFSLCSTDLTGKPSSTQALTVSNAAVPIRIGDAAAGCAGNRLAGDVTITGNLAVTFGNNMAATLVKIDNNGPGSTTIKANTVFGTLSCTGNNPPPTNAGQSNSGPNKTGQCAAL